MKVLLVANVPTHYRMPLYEELQRRVDLEVLFYSDGQEWYWQRTSAPPTSSLRSGRVLSGFWVGRTRLVPSLLPAVLRSRADVVVKDPNGKFALPVTYLGARLRRRPFVLWASLWEHPTTFVHRLSRPLMRYLYRHSDAVVTYGRHVTRHVVSEGADPARVVVSPQAARAFAPVPVSADRWSSPLRLLYVGRLEPWKGLDVLLHAVAALPRGACSLEVVGSGSSLAESSALASSLGIDVTFTGSVPPEDLRDVYARAAVVVVPSRRTADFSEPWSLVVNEAMNAGCLVVATDAVGAVRDGLLTDGVTGVVVPSDDAAALARALSSLLSAPRLDLAAAGQAAVASYTHDVAADAFVTAARLALAHRSGQ